MEELASPTDGGNWTATKKYLNCGFVYHKEAFLCRFNFCHFKLSLEPICLYTTREMIFFSENVLVIQEIKHLGSAFPEASNILFEDCHSTHFVRRSNYSLNSSKNSLNYSLNFSVKRRYNFLTIYELLVITFFFPRFLLFLLPKRRLWKNISTHRCTQKEENHI